MYVDLCESDLEVWLGRKLLLSVVIFPTLSVFFFPFFFLFFVFVFKGEETNQNSWVRPTLFTDLWERGPFCA